MHLNRARIGLTLLSTLAVAACTAAELTQDEFAIAYSRGLCEITFECTPELPAQNDIHSLADCEERYITITQEWLQEGTSEANCIFDPQQAERCLDALSALNCESDDDAVDAECDHVLRNCDNGEPTEFNCSDGNGTVPGNFQCDGEEDCNDGSDEANCDG